MAYTAQHNNINKRFKHLIVFGDIAKSYGNIAKWVIDIVKLITDIVKWITDIAQSFGDIAKYLAISLIN